MPIRFGSATILLSLLTIVSCSDSNPEMSTDPLPTDSTDQHLSTLVDDSWPPQPVAMENVQPMPASALSGARNSVLEAARTSIMNNPATRSLLGSNYLDFGGSLSGDKSDSTAAFLFFNYTSNETIEIFLGRDGGITTDTYPAAEFQPTEHEDEVDQAIALAQTHLREAGFETEALNGTAMLAFPRAAASSLDNQQPFYPQRMLYVTFGPGNGELPIYTALVDVSNQLVTEAGPVQ